MPFYRLAPGRPVARQSWEADVPALRAPRAGPSTPWGFANPRWRGIVPLSSPSEYYSDAHILWWKLTSRDEPDLMVYWPLRASENFPLKQAKLLIETKPGSPSETSSGRPLGEAEHISPMATVPFASFRYGGTYQGFSAPRSQKPLGRSATFRPQGSDASPKAERENGALRLGAELCAHALTSVGC